MVNKFRTIPLDYTTFVVAPTSYEALMTAIEQFSSHAQTLVCENVDDECSTITFKYSRGYTELLLTYLYTVNRTASNGFMVTLKLTDKIMVGVEDS